MITVIVMLFATVIVHELAHALALRKLGVRINEAGLGLPFPPVLRIPTRWGITFTLSPWLVGAYVSCSDEDSERLDAMPYRDQAWYLNAGIVANLLLAFGAFAANRAMLGEWWRCAGDLLAVAVTWAARRWIAAWVLPVLSVGALGTLGYGLILSWRAGDTGMGFAGLGEIAPHGAADTVATLGLLSLAVAIMNMLPLFGLDNGKVVALALRRWLPARGLSIYKGVGVAVVAVLILGSIVSDAWKAIAAVFS